MRPTDTKRQTNLEQRGRILMIAMERAQARDLGLEQAAKILDSADAHGSPNRRYWLDLLAQRIRALKAIP